MQLNEPLLREFSYEFTNTRKMLERVPAQSFSWKPHEKSMSLGKIASHLAGIPSYQTFIATQNGIDVSKGSLSPKTYDDIETLLQDFDANVAKGTEALQSVNNESMLANWTLSSGDHVIFTLPRIAVFRQMVLNHMVHHRGQISVYLRLLNVPVPGMYGPSYDEMPV